MTFYDQVRAFKRDLLARAIREYGGISAAAKALGMNRTHMQKLCATLDVPRTRRNGRRGNWGDEGRERLLRDH